MHKFTDQSGNDWIIRIATPDVLKVRDEVGVDLLDAEVFPRFITDYVLLVQVLWVVCERQAADRNTDAEAFGRMLAGEMLEKGAEALFGSLVDFFPPRRQAMFRAVLTKAHELEATAINHGMATIQSGRMVELLQKHLAELDAERDRTFSGVDSGDSPASSESTSPASA